MPAKMIGTMAYYDRLTKAEEQAFWHEQRHSAGIPLSARSIQAVKDRKKVSVGPRTVPKKLLHNPG